MELIAAISFSIVWNPVWIHFSSTSLHSVSQRSAVYTPYVPYIDLIRLEVVFFGCGNKLYVGLRLQRYFVYGSDGGPFLSFVVCSVSQRFLGVACCDA